MDRETMTPEKAKRMAGCASFIDPPTAADDVRDLVEAYLALTARLEAAEQEKARLLEIFGSIREDSDPWIGSGLNERGQTWASYFCCWCHVTLDGDYSTFDDPPPHPQNGCPRALPKGPRT